MFKNVTDSHPALPVRRKCELSGLARSNYYRMVQTASTGKCPVDGALRSEIEKICADMSSYGYRRVTFELQRSGLRINRKRVLRLMREDNLLCRRKRKWITTTDSSHPYRVYPNLVQGIVPTKLNQIWNADITYIRLQREFVFLAVILDALSRRAIGWALSRHIDTALTLCALRMALKARSVTSGLTHHSDRGVQYAASEYTELLKANGIAISMSRKGNPYDNARAEAFMKTLKYEEVHLNEYKTLSDARENIDHFIEKVYNSKRLHSSLGYQPPIEFEAKFLNSLNQKHSTLMTGLSVSF
jgi:transposase InsO family protein